MKFLWFSLQLVIAAAPMAASADPCASQFSRLDQTPRLKAVKNLFISHESSALGFVNQTRGSYFIIDATQDDLVLRFYTSGLFDLYGIHNNWPVTFCDNGISLVMTGHGRREVISVGDDVVVIGKGGPRQTFRPGEMPELLQRLHHLNSHGIASENGSR